MLLLARAKEESVKIGDCVTVKVLRLNRHSVTLGFSAPPSVKIVRSEIADAREVSSLQLSLDRLIDCVLMMQRENRVHEIEALVDALNDYQIESRGMRMFAYSRTHDRIVEIGKDVSTDGELATDGPF